MPYLIEHISEAVFAVNLCVLLAASLLIGAAFLRRRLREKYFRRIDGLRKRYAPLIAGVLEGKIKYGECRDALSAISGANKLHDLELLLLEKRPEPSQVSLLSQLCEDLGLVEIWLQQLNGTMDAKGRVNAGATPRGNSARLGYLVRASSANNLGIILHQPSWPMLANALGDAHPDVVSVAARSLAAIGEPKSFLPLLDCLYAVIIDNSRQVSLRSVKMALVSFPLAQASQLLPSLKHPHRRIRFLAADIIREMVERGALANENVSAAGLGFAPELAEIYLSGLCIDENPDVRARSAPVIAYLDDTRATGALLALLEDSEWFVRMHAARALARNKFMSSAPKIAQRLTDSQWMVREATTRTLLSFGQEGLDCLIDHALNTRDRYSKEQIADEFQRAGVIPTLLAQYARTQNAREIHVLRQFADLGKTSCMLAAMEESSDRFLRRKFLADFGRHPDPQIRGWVKSLDGGAPHLELPRGAAVRAAMRPHEEGA